LAKHLAQELLARIDPPPPRGDKLAPSRGIEPRFEP
jgi:hypothetical protein